MEKTSILTAKIVPTDWLVSRLGWAWVGGSF